jgi:hypothetical protein
VRRGRALYLNDIVTAGLTLGDPARATARWIEDTVEAIDAAPPPPQGRVLGSPPRAGARRHGVGPPVGAAGFEPR